MTAFFITAIGTNVGKTFFTSALCHQLREQNKQVRALKPVISGYDESDHNASDTGILMQASGETNRDETSPWRYAAPLSPHLAAAIENRPIDPFALVKWCQQRITKEIITLIEGVGGIMVPITPDYTVLDWMRALDIPVILVAGTYLGAINHTLLSIDQLKRHGLMIHAVVISQSVEYDCGLDATSQSIAPWVSSHTQIIPLPRISSWQCAPNLLSLMDEH